MGRTFLNLMRRLAGNAVMLKSTAAIVLVAVAVLAATGAQAQRHHHHRRAAEPERAPPPPSVDKRDSIVSAPAAGGFSGRPYWLALAQCGGIFFKLNIFYTDVAVRARVTKPDPKVNAEYTRKLGEAIRIATTYYDGAERFLKNDRGLERAQAVLAYEGQSRAAGDRLKTIEAALLAAKACPILYQACQAAYPKACSEPLAPLS